jgi:hypothetical protein
MILLNGSVLAFILVSWSASFVQFLVEIMVFEVKLFFYTGFWSASFVQFLVEIMVFEVN